MKQQILCCGLPGSGKTTYLAALWHLVSERELPTVLGFHSLGSGDNLHLNNIAARWRNAQAQIRTEVAAERTVAMNLVDRTGAQIQLTFPDLSGETFKRMWVDRDCEPTLQPLVTASSADLLFVHADKITAPRWIVDEVADARALGELESEEKVEEVTWLATMAPTQVMAVDVLQLLGRRPLGPRQRRIAVVLSAWDKVAPEGRTPGNFLAERMPLLNQHLKSVTTQDQLAVYGISAQGGDFTTEADRLLAEDVPSKRIKVVGGSGAAHDLTEPLHWLMSAT